MNNDFIIENGILTQYTGEGSDVVIPDGVTKIGASAFTGCAQLIRVHIPDSVTEIGKFAFEGCRKLKRLHLPDSVTSIGDGAFANCAALADADGFVILRSILYSYHSDAVDVVIPEGVTELSYGAFWNCSHLKSIRIPDSVTKIGTLAFHGCTGLTDADGFIILRNTLFHYHGSRADVVIPDGITKIAHGAFDGCEVLSSIDIPDSVTEIEPFAFQGCKNLKRIRIPKSVTQIGKYALHGCDILTDITAPNVELMSFPPSIRDIAARRFLHTYKQCTDRNVFEENEIYILSHFSRFLSAIFSEDDAAALVFFAEIGDIAPSTFENKYLTPALEAGAAECIAFLLKWKSIHFPNTNDEFEL